MKIFKKKNTSCLKWFDPWSSSYNPNLLIPPQDWIPPPKGALKWNIAASFNGARAIYAISGVLHNEEGLFKCRFSKPILDIEIKCVEVIAIYKTIQISMTCEILKGRPIIVESDSSNAVQWCNSDSGGPWNMNFQLNFIRCARTRGLKVEIIHKGRRSNFMANSLAKW